VWIYTGNKLAKFHGNILSLSENIAKSFRGGGTFLTHTQVASAAVFSERKLAFYINKMSTKIN